MSIEKEVRDYLRGMRDEIVRNKVFLQEAVFTGNEVLAKQIDDNNYVLFFSHYQVLCEIRNQVSAMIDDNPGDKRRLMQMNESLLGIIDLCLEQMNDYTDRIIGEERLT